MKIQAFDYSVNLLRALLWQYNEAARLEGLVQQKQDWYNVAQSEFWSNWYDDVFNLQTANDFGLTVWAIILGLPLAVTLPVPDDQDFFGFAPDDVNFTNGGFAGSSGPIVLNTEQKRLALRLRYYQLTTRFSVTQANAIIAAVFGPGAGYVVDGLNMRIRYVFSIPLSPDLQFVLTQYDLLPRPAGVMADFVILGETDGFGFGAYHFNFNQGNFYHA